MIYFIQQGIDGPIKIGTTDNVNKRLLSLQTGSPHKLRLIGTMDGDEEKEKQLHNFFSAYRLSGEWFSPDRTMFDYIFTSITGVDFPAQCTGLDLKVHIARTERIIIERALAMSNGTISRTAKLLNITRPTLYSKIKEYGIIQKNITLE